MKKYLYSFIAVSATTFFIGCGNSSSNNSNPNNGYYPNGTPTCTWVYNGNTPTCINGNGTVVTNTTGVTAQVRFYDYKFYFNMVTGEYRPDYSGGLSIVHQGAYQQFLQEALKVCNLSTWNWGGADCATWSQGSLQVTFTIDGSMKPTLEFRAVPAQSMFTGNLGFFTGGATLNPLILSGNTTFSLTNNSKGFELRSNGSPYNGGGLNLIQIQVDNGTLADRSFTYRIAYPYGSAGNKVPTVFATGTFQKY